MKRSILKECLRIARAKNTPELHPEYQGYVHFSFIIQKNKIIEWGMNRSDRAWYPIYARLDKKRHAEEDAFSKARSIIDKQKVWEVVNIRLNRQNEFRLSKPCQICRKYLKFFGCNKAWYSTETGWKKLNLQC